MPCMKCDNGKWKWGHRGDCRYNSREECERANRGRHEEDPGDVRADDVEFWERRAQNSKLWGIRIADGTAAWWGSNPPKSASCEDIKMNVVLQEKSVANSKRQYREWGKRDREILSTFRGLLANAEKTVR